MNSNFDRIHAEALSAIDRAENLVALDEVRIQLLGKKGTLTEVLKTLGQATPEERKELGAQLNSLKNAISEAMDARHAELKARAIEERLITERQDVTLPVRMLTQGKIHPVSQVIDELLAIFADMGFAVAEGPDVEDDEHNFTALNFPEAHPARQMHDTFFMNAPEGANGRSILRTHTSPVQIRTMRAGKPPFRIVVPGAAYRCDSDQTHTPMFHQMEALVIDKNIHMGHLKGTLIEFLKAFFELDDVPVRLRPSFFPFTEPSAEVDIGCSRKNGELKIGAGDGWLEVLGAGMVHPNVLRNCGLDPEVWQGFAFGCGIDRLAMLKYGIPDLRTFFESDIRWLNHYGFDPLDIPSLAGGLSK